MASLENRNGSWRVIFMWKGEKKSFSLGEVSATDALVSKSTAEQLLRLLKQGLLHTNGHPIETFLRYGGKPPEPDTVPGETPGEKPPYTLAQLRDEYLASARRRLDAETARIAGYHFQHLTDAIPEGQPLDLLTRDDLQKYIDRRARAGILPSTIKNEVKTLRTAWNWGRQFGPVKGDFPAKGLWYPKTVDPLPFMTIDEAQRRIAAGEDAEAVWDSVYLRPEETAAVLAWVRQQALPPWVYVLFVFAAHTGARRSEMLRSLPADINLAGGQILLREKKRDVTKVTFRHVPMTAQLREVLEQWLQQRPKGEFLFASSTSRAKPHLEGSSVRDYFHVALEKSPWAQLRGWHVFRHSFISALASRGVDQRIIDDLVGHSTEEQRRRYRHLYPDVKHKAVLDVFGGTKAPLADAAKGAISTTENQDG